MLGHIYYTVGLIVTFSILSLILRYRKIYNVREWYQKYEKVTKIRPDKNNFRNKEELFLFESSNGIQIFEILWLFGGLITSSWCIFMLVLILQLIYKYLLNLINFSFFGKIISISFLFGKFLLYLYLIINHFHLHQDTYLLIKDFFK